MTGEELTLDPRRDPQGQVHRSVYQVEVFSRGPFDTGMSEVSVLAQIDYAISEDDCVGHVQLLSEEVVPAGELRGHLLRIGDDGSFAERLGAAPGGVAIWST